MARIIDRLKQANTSDQAFEEELRKLVGTYQDFPVEDYVKYREVEGVEEAIARNFLLWTPGQSISNGVKTRDAVLAILLDKENEINTNLYPGNYNEFREDILKLKGQL